MTRAVDAPVLILDVIDSRGMQLSGRRIAIPAHSGTQRLSIAMACEFQKGVYRLRLRLVSAPTIEQTLLMSRFDDLLSLEMIDDVRHKFTGLFPLSMQLDWQVLEP
jgi:lipopolysaccharide transport system ATP-binding protein